jgi:hypothetical protein
MTPRIPRVCVKLYADSAAVPDETFIPIFHRWIRDRALDLVFIDVADYAHVPDGPGVMLVTDAIAFALDRSDGRFGLLAQQRRPGHGSTADAIALALRQTLDVADALERERALAGKLSFVRNAFRLEINDRLAAPANDDASYLALRPSIEGAAQRVFPDRRPTIARVFGDARDRLAVDVVLGAA